MVRPSGVPADDVSSWLRWQETLHTRQVDLGLDRVREVLGRLALRPPAGRVITVGGTNGKGSTITLLHDCLEAAGGRPGLYTSPHLCVYNERIRVRGASIPDAALLRAFRRVEEARQDASLTYFEFGTLAAFVCFAEGGCDTWLLEVGLGGRLDAVNVLDADLALITTIGLDHQEWLGDTVEAIAAEKAGILRVGRPGLYGDTPVPAAIRERAAALGTRFGTFGATYSYDQGQVPGTWQWRAADLQVDNLRAPPHWTAAQFRNASLALAALRDLTPSVPLTPAFLNPVLLRSSPPGRFQQVHRDHEWILDVAHNPQAAAVLRQQLATLPPPAGGADSVTVVVALLADKAITEFMRALGPVANRWIVSGVDDPRASSEAHLRTAIAAAGIADASWADEPVAAFELARQATPAGGRIVVCGSFRIVAPAMQWLGLY